MSESSILVRARYGYKLSDSSGLCDSSILYNFMQIENIQIMFYFFFKSYGEDWLIKSVKILLFIIKLVNPIQKHPNIIQSYACIL